MTDQKISAGGERRGKQTLITQDDFGGPLGYVRAGRGMSTGNERHGQRRVARYRIILDGLTSARFWPHHSCDEAVADAATEIMQLPICDLIAALRSREGGPGAYRCVECGALVTDALTHNMWHNQMASRPPSGEVTERSKYVCCCGECKLEPEPWEWTENEVEAAYIAAQGWARIGKAGIKAILNAARTGRR